MFFFCFFFIVTRGHVCAIADFNGVGGGLSGVRHTDGETGGAEGKIVVGLLG